MTHHQQPTTTMAVIIALYVVFLCQHGLSAQPQPPTPGTTADSGVLSSGNVCDVQSVDFRNLSASTVTLNANDTQDCPLEVNTSPDEWLEFIIIYANVTDLDYLYVDLHETNASPERYLSLTGQIQQCSLLLQSSHIVLHIRTNVVIKLHRRSKKTVSTSLTVTTTGSQSQDEPTCGEMNHYESIIMCDAQYKYVRMFRLGAMEATCNITCPIDCSCALHQGEIRYRCPDGVSGARLLIFPPETHVHDLEFLFVPNSDLTEIGIDSFQSIPWIVQLMVTGANRLTGLKNGVFRDMQYMVELDLSYNSIEIIEPDVFKDLIRLQLLYLKGNRLAEIHDNAFDGLKYIMSLRLANNSIQTLPDDVFRDQEHLRLLDLSRNRLTSIPKINHLSRLTWLYLRYNSIMTLAEDAFRGLSMLSQLHLHNNSLTILDSPMFQGASRLSLLTIDGNRLRSIDPALWFELPGLQRLNISYNSLQDLRSHTFDNLSDLVSLDLQHNQLRKLDRTSFDQLSNSTTLYVDDVSACYCYGHSTKCISRNPRPPFMTCDRLMPNVALRMFMWLLGFGALFGNAFVIFWRCNKRKHSKVQPVQRSIILNLAVSDLLMGIYLIIIISADTHFGHYFPLYSEDWRTSSVCKIAGIIAITSSEASVFFVTLISIDRFLGVLFPFKQYRISQKKLAVIVTFMWTTALTLATVPTLLAGTNKKFYEVSQTCIGFPLVRQYLYDIKNVTYNQDWKVSLESTFSTSDVSGSSSWMYFSIAIFLGLNFVCCIIIFLCYLAIFLAVRKTTVPVGRFKERQAEEIRMAFKMALIVLTDFLCWMPIIIIGILVQADAIKPLSPNVYAWTSVFVLPINSAVNPFLYTLVTAIVDRYDPKRRQSYGSVPYRTSTTRRTTWTSTSKDIHTLSGTHGDLLNGTKEDPV